MGKEKHDIDVENNAGHDKHDDHAKKNEDSKRAAIKPEVLELSKKIRQSLKLGDNGQFEVDSKVYEQGLPEDLKIEDVKKVHGYDMCFIHAATHAFGEASLEVFKKGKKVEETKAVFPMVGRNTLTVEAKRERENRPIREGAEATTTYCALSVDYGVYEASASRGQLKRIKESIQQAAAEAYGK